MVRIGIVRIMVMMLSSGSFGIDAIGLIRLFGCLRQVFIVKSSMVIIVRMLII